MASLILPAVILGRALNEVLIAGSKHYPPRVPAHTVVSKTVIRYSDHFLQLHVSASHWVSFFLFLVCFALDPAVRTVLCGTALIARNCARFTSAGPQPRRPARDTWATPPAAKPAGV